MYIHLFTALIETYRLILLLTLVIFRGTVPLNKHNKPNLTIWKRNKRRKWNRNKGKYAKQVKGNNVEQK